MIREISKGVSQICVKDRETELFEGQYPIPEGITYNSYVIIDEHCALMDTADVHFYEQWAAEAGSALAGRHPEYLIILHMEPDHSGSVAKAMELFPDMKIAASAKAIAMLGQFFEDIDLEGRTVELGEGSTLTLGETTLRFFTAPMVHWPEVLVAYDAGRKLVFSADAFGTFGVDSPADVEGWKSEARRYYANICGKYGAQVHALLGKLAALDVATIAPLHGPLLHAPLEGYIGLYEKWSTYAPEENGVLIAYASIYGGTEKAALKLEELLRERGVKTVMSNLGHGHLSYAVGEAFRMSALVLAAPTYDGDIFPPMHSFLHHLHIKGFRNRPVGLVENGSWAPQAARLMTASLEAMKGIEILEPVVTIKSTLRHRDLPALEALADTLAAATH